MKLLVLGGTKFLGRHVVSHALAAGHRVTLFTRGLTGPAAFPEAERLTGDRDGDLGALAGGRWDAVVDTSGYVPRVVRASAELLRDRVEVYAFVSSISAYADLSAVVDETSPLATLEDETVEAMGDLYENYGGLKALCEREVERALPGRALVLRPGLIVGPHDPTGRFTYWPLRLARGGAVLVPGPPERRWQFVDGRDLARWLVQLLERRTTGVLNATGAGESVADLVRAGRAASGSDASPVWVDDEFLREQGVGEWMELPLWIADPLLAGMHRVDVSQALEAGLTFRPLQETVADTLAWARAEGVEQPAGVGLAPRREAELLAAWASRE